MPLGCLVTRESCSTDSRYKGASNQWEVTLRLNSAGASAFGALTLHQYNTYYRAAQAGNQDDQVLDTIAVVLDGNVVSAPQIQSAIPGGNAQITGNFTRAQAEELVAQIAASVEGLSEVTHWQESQTTGADRCEVVADNT